MSLTSKLIPQKLHRKIEKALQIEKNCLKEQVKQLKEMKKTDEEIYAAVKGCLEWLQVYNPTGNFVVAFQLYISCLKNPPKEIPTDTY